MARKNTSKYNLVLSVMIFSFLWVIIGDLVAMHAKLIYDVDIQDQSPFAKTQKSDKKVYQVQKNKASDDDNSSGIVFISTTQNLVFLIKSENIIRFFTDESTNVSVFNLYLGRAPPTC